MNKTLKFESHLIPLILSGKKRNTWRLFDDKNLTVGDIVDFLDKETKEKVVTARLTQVIEKAFNDLTEVDWDGYKKYKSESEMFEHYTKYYHQPIDGSTKLKIIWFELIP